jgi:hypothetical protein
MSTPAAQTQWTVFGPDPAWSSLPSEMQACILKPSQLCDVAIGDATSGQGFCGTPSYEQTTYCSCVNNAVACAQTTMASCANSAYSYKPYSTSVPGPSGKSADQVCASTPTCVSIVDISGSQNVVSGVTMQCGVITNITNVIKTNPVLAGLIAVLFIALLIVMSLSVDDKRIMPLPPPSDIFGGAATFKEECK